LHDELKRHYPGSIIPPLPDKQTVGRFTPEFIESRRRGIEKFMSRVTAHSVLKNAACLVSFLQLDDAGFGQYKTQCKQERSAASGSVTDWFGDKINTMSTQTTIEHTEDDDKVQGALDYVLAWERQLSVVAKQASQIVKCARDKSKALFEFGQAFSSLGLNESNQELGDVLFNVGVVAAKFFFY
jgi:sorting nexin-1/2